MREQLIPFNEKMEKTLAVLAEDYASIRAGRANPGVLDRISVEYYGAMTPINQMAAISVAEARILVIQPWDRSSLKSIEKAINASDRHPAPKRRKLYSPCVPAAYRGTP